MDEEGPYVDMKKAIYVNMNNIYDKPRRLGLKGDYENCVKHNYNTLSTINLKEEFDCAYFMPKKIEQLKKDTELKSKDTLLVSPPRNIKKSYHSKEFWEFA